MNDITEFVTIDDGGHLVTDSRKVAQHFQKRHDSILRAIDRLDCSDDYRRRNFAETVTTRQNPSGGKPIQSRYVLMTKNGFVFLVMGFTGREAARIKEAYINAFDAMADQLREQNLSLWHQRQLLEMRDQSSFVRAQFGSRLMLARRADKPVIESMRAQLEQAMQVELIPGEKAA